MKIVTIPCSFDNYSYLALCEQSRKAAVVDPAEFYPIQKYLDSSDITLEAILCTHHHYDHIGGLEEMLAQYPGMKVYGHESDQQRILGLNKPVSDDDILAIGDHEVRVLHTPGHTIGSVCYLLENHLFSGDTLFGGGCGRVFEGTYEQMYSSLMNRLVLLPGDIKVYFGHEYTLANLLFAQFVEHDSESVNSRYEAVKQQRDEGGVTSPSTLSLEKKTNPFLRCADPRLIRSLQTKSIVEDEKPVSVFSALRRLKDSF